MVGIKLAMTVLIQMITTMAASIPLQVFDPSDDRQSPLAEYYANRIEDYFYNPKKAPSMMTLQGVKPLLIMNGTIDGKISKEVPRQNLIFEFTPYHYGAEGLGYRPTSDFSESWTKINNVVTISAAALDKTGLSVWSKIRPIFGLTLGRQLVSTLSQPSETFWLSDGGHSENLGAYALIKRRCQNIVIVDAEYDSSFNFEGYRIIQKMLESKDLRLTVQKIDDYYNRLPDSERMIWTLPVMHGQVVSTKDDTRSIPIIWNNEILDRPLDVMYLKLSMDPCQTTENQAVSPLKKVNDCRQTQGSYVYNNALRDLALRSWWEDYPDKRLGLLGLITGPLTIEEEWKEFPQISTGRQDLPLQIVNALIALGHCHMTHAIAQKSEKPPDQCPAPR